MIHLYEIDGAKFDIHFESVLELEHFLEDYFNKSLKIGYVPLCKEGGKKWRK